MQSSITLPGATSGKTLVSAVPTDREIARALVAAMPIERRKRLVMMRIDKDWRLRVGAWHAVRNCIDARARRNMEASAHALAARRATETRPETCAFTGVTYGV